MVTGETVCLVANGLLLVAGVGSVGVSVVCDVAARWRGGAGRGDWVSAVSPL